MPHGLIQIEQERSDLWKAEVEAGFPVCKRKMLHATTFEDVMTQVSATFRELVPPPHDLKAAAALKEAEAHFQSVIAVIDEFLSWSPDLDKEQFMDRLRSHRQIFETRLATHDPGYGLMPVDEPDVYAGSIVGGRRTSRSRAGVRGGPGAAARPGGDRSRSGARWGHGVLDTRRFAYVSRHTHSKTRAGARWFA